MAGSTTSTSTGPRGEHGQDAQGHATAPAASTTSPWDEHLTALSAAVRRTRAALADGDRTGAPIDFQPPPAPDEPLDVHDHERTTVVLGEVEELVELLSAVRRDVGTQLAHSRRWAAVRTTGTAPHYVDGYG